MKRLLLSVFVAFTIVAQLQSQTFTYGDSRDEQGFNLKAQSDQGITLNYSIHEFIMDDIDIRGESMKHISLASGQRALYCCSPGCHAHPPYHFDQKRNLPGC
jgi:hypothetical protein